MAIWGMFILWGWGSFGTDIGYVNIVGGREPGTEFGDVNIVEAREGEGGQTLRMLIWGGGELVDINGYAHIMGVGVFWDRHWGMGMLIF